MSKVTPVHEWEAVVADELSGESWTIQPGQHVGHTMRVVGRIAANGTLSSMFLVRCEPCGEMYRMAAPTIDKALTRRDERTLAIADAFTPPDPFSRKV